MQEQQRYKQIAAVLNECVGVTTATAEVTAACSDLQTLIMLYLRDLDIGCCVKECGMV